MMIDLPAALCFVAALGFLGWVLWLWQQRPRDTAASVRLARDAAERSARLVSESEEALKRAEDTLSRRFTQARDALMAENVKHVETVRAETESIRRDMNALAAAAGLMRNGAKFATPPPTAPVREVLR